MAFAHRTAAHEDFPIIAAFPQSPEELFYMFPKGQYPLAPEQLEEAALRRLEPTVILRDGQIAGYGNLYTDEDRQEYWLGNVIVAPGVRNSGAGTYLIQTMKEKARSYQAKQLNLVCHNTNTKALLFYFKQGFLPYGLKQMEDYKGDRIAGILMAIDL
ncbi:N-acetyltransferase [Paenibacillus sp. J31TS4]|uniref:GNAT family N-acetyltransferase n=1 Tax=Paenibacillus sp. J31TS4 TaxID=2807195 RepID=UPI001B2F5C07|nr:GNAT family N-acetyltransferase [Paenibacillus sp. J31TS4]GIP39102.1 N-acetyltransferase [Paenibacillus sp. J31TS4]